MIKAKAKVKAKAMIKAKAKAMIKAIPPLPLRSLVAVAKSSQDLSKISSMYWFGDWSAVLDSNSGPEGAPSPPAQENKHGPWARIPGWSLPVPFGFS